MSGLLGGAAAASIAPRATDLDEGVYLGGFGAYRQRRATGIHDEPYCRALALSDGTTLFVVASLDLVGARSTLLDSIRTAGARATRLPPENILVACTHTHASPDTQGLWGGTGAAYQAHVAKQASRAIAQAYRAMAPVTLRASTTSLAGVVRNRRGWPQTDETLTTLSVSAANGGSVATLVNYACHPTAIGPSSPDVSRDWCGYAVDAIEREAGGVAIYVNGAIGDANPLFDGGFEQAQSLGEAVARRAVESLLDAQTVRGSVSLRTEPLLLPLNLERLSERVQGAVARAAPALSLLTKAGGLHAAAVALHAAGRADVAQLVAALAGMSERGLTHRDGRTFVATRCGYLRIGDGIEAFAAPGEVLTRLAQPLRASLGAPHRLLLGLTHDTLGYFVPEDEWMTGRNNDYEESVSMGKHAATALADALLSLVPQGQIARAADPAQEAG